MGPRPFRLPLALGTDICQTSRITSLLTRPRPPSHRITTTTTTTAASAPAHTPVNDHASSKLLPGLDPFLRRLMTRTERAHFHARFGPAIRSLDRGNVGPQETGDVVGLLARHLAGRFAAKEAMMKAASSRQGNGVGWHDVVILDGASGPGEGGARTSTATTAPRAVVLDAAAASNRADGGGGVVGEKSPSFEEMSGQEVRLSISHDGDYATAVCLMTTD